MSKKASKGKRFIGDRMVGTLTRYLRFLGYDVKSANSLQQGNSREDTILLEMAQRDARLLLTRDRELARRGGARAVLIETEDVLEQLRQLITLGVIDPDFELRMQRCSLCNTRLRPASPAQIRKSEYAPAEKAGIDFFWCSRCKKLYWMGTHGKNLSERLEELKKIVDVCQY